MGRGGAGGEGPPSVGADESLEVGARAEVRIDARRVTTRALQRSRPPSGARRQESQADIVSPCGVVDLESRITSLQ
jgi:hypothetical protein